ncbi:MAG: DNA polymerase III subunit epsilon [Gammaproteobacteria bacterium]|nr:DNA polymerase III subunit epsilon [Gammaproteobacteria bacterium]MDH3406467.1 DNA polymerase III subunit epsilon [Gammaproteobacteria bacterium]MDH5487606.1 DNA polymerase III subunit epsilon [Gammaproteobacteria bacterium]
MRQIILDTETTGLEPSEGHRIIEIGCVELISRRPSNNRYQQYLNPEREIDQGAIEVHGITNEQLAGKPKFADIAQSLLDFIEGAELIIHNAPFDLGFLNSELSRMAKANGGKAVRIEDVSTVVDTLKLARGLHPGQKNDLDSLCKRYNVDNSHRTLHGALLDAEILADVYLAMTGGQAALFEDTHSHLKSATTSHVAATSDIRRLDPKRPKLPVIAPSVEELAAHADWLDELDMKSGGKCVWKKLELTS